MKLKFEISDEYISNSPGFISNVSRGETRLANVFIQIVSKNPILISYIFIIETDDSQRRPYLESNIHQSSHSSFTKIGSFLALSRIVVDIFDYGKRFPYGGFPSEFNEWHYIVPLASSIRYFYRTFPCWSRINERVSSGKGWQDTEVPPWSQK